MSELDQMLSSCDLLSSQVEMILQTLIDSLPQILSSISAQHAQSPQAPSYIQLTGDDIMKPDQNISVFLHWPDTKFAPKSPVPRKVPHFHYHDFYEINYLYRGGVTNRLPDATIHQDRSQILLMNPHAYHDPVIDSPDTLLFNILIRKEFSAELLSGYSPSGTELIHLFLDNSLGMGPLKPYLTFDNTPAINFVLQQMIVEFYQDKQYSQQLLYAKLIELWSLLARQQDEKFEQNKRQHNIPEDVIQILSYLRKNCAVADLASTAKQFGFTPNYLSQYLYKYTGHHYSEIVLNIKMHNAVNYLLHSNSSIPEIAEMTGYSDVSYFRKVFKKEFGVSPGAYRNQRQ